MSVRGIPAQDLPENQDPGVQYTVDEVTQQVTPWEKPKKKAEPAPEPKRRGRPPKDKEARDEPAAAEGEGE